MVALLVALAGSAGNCVNGTQTAGAGTVRQDATLAWVLALEDRMGRLEAICDSLRARPRHHAAVHPAGP